MKIFAGLVLVLACMAQAASDRVVPPDSGYSSASSGLRAPGAMEKWLHGLPSIVCWGDSLTSASYPRILAKLTGRPVTSRGVGGNTSAQIAARQGGRPTYMTLVGGRIPASGAVRVESFTVTPMGIYGKQVIEGSIGGVAGVLRRISQETYEFTRTTPGAAVEVPVALPFMPDVGETDFEIAVIWAGRNNYDEPAQVLSDVRAMVEFLKPLNKRFVVLSPPNGNYRDEYIGAPNYHYFVEIRDGLRNSYPNNFLDVWQLLVQSYDPSDPRDVADYQKGIPPHSLRDDDIHLNEAGNRKVAAWVRDYLIGFKGY